MICFPNAKINLGLHIVAKRADGFHDIESVFYPIDWCDSLEAIENRSFRKNGNKIALQTSGIQTGNPADNLVTKAYELLDKKYDLPPVKVHLHKNIPTGAGLGGGSSDAAFFIKLLDEKFGLKLPTSTKLNLAGKTGSDCPFFIHNKPVLAKGKGNILSPVKTSLENFRIAVVYPGIHSNTAQAYKGVAPRLPEKNIGRIMQGPVKTWKKELVNDFERTVFVRYPQLAEIKKMLYKKGAVYASMSGSGSAVYGIFEKGSKKINYDFPSTYSTWTS